jgi:Fe-Mn family superoxide dismutase
MNREIKLTFIAGIIFTLFFIFGCSSQKKVDQIKQVKLNYSTNALEPYISSRTVKLHYDVHYKKYVENSNELIKKSGFGEKSVSDILRKIKGNEKYFSLFNNLGQALNHEIYFNSLAPKAKPPAGNMLEMINSSFGSYNAFKKEFILKGSTHFASGWVWLVKNNDKLEILTTSNGDNPVTFGLVPVLGIDLWEHSYYLDYENKKSDYMKNVTEKLLNWDYAASVCFK